MNRRHFLLAGLGASALLGVGAASAARQRVWNPCRATLPSAVLEHDIVLAAWDGIDAKQLWDVHAHLAGTGDSGGGIRMNPRMLSPLHPTEYIQRLFYLNAGCAHEALEAAVRDGARAVK